MTGILYALLATTIWGASDFYGGQAARRHHHYQVLAIAAGSGLLVLTALTLASGERLPGWESCLWATAAGIAGAVGIATLYRGLSLGHTALVSPVAAVIGAAIPALAGTVIQGLPGVTQIAGFACGLAGIGLVSSTPGAQPGARRRGLGFALLAGIGFGGYFIFIAQVEPGQVFAPLTVAKMVSLLTAMVVLRTRRLKMIHPAQSPMALITGLLDAGGNIFYLLAAQNARLDIAAVLSSMYPAGTVLLARLVVDEKISMLQWLGVGLCLAAVGLITL
jgi:drug/metabolite transporter (DMT)-like permease